MDMLKTGWNFFQNEVVGMAWLNRLIGNLINACGLDATSKIGGGIHPLFTTQSKSWCC